MTDLTYKKQGMFTAFYAENEQGKKAFAQLSADGSGKILTIQLGKALADLKAAGYIAGKAKESTLSDEELAELGI